MAPWLEGLRTVAQPVVGALPALVVVLFAGLLMLLGLFFRADGRAYVLGCASWLVDLAAVVVGSPRNRSGGAGRRR
ncbi:hypothetical protein [Pseudofrankia sp. BMG5.37]|uniref:hypothetical protein n=1 Tax=Pseudofrankia sp. BMG5.37 TaxID=3050035 RepID=UPI002895F0E2|nr:hypothetical protein [Pseudofrankia sp. BMG5.37]MDT3447016.1 hypothetical protein [Pseudofrankia sp. BMG5.37]